ERRSAGRNAILGSSTHHAPRNPPRITHHEAHMIWDLHCHINVPGGRTPDESMARLIVLADRMGIDRLVIFMGDRLVIDPSPEELRRQNDQVLQALSHWHHRAFGFVYVSPKHVAASLREIDRCVRDGPMVGLK